jgi:hypothetical protein
VEIKYSNENLREVACVCCYGMKSPFFLHTTGPISTAILTVLEVPYFHNHQDCIVKNSYARTNLGGA